MDKAKLVKDFEMVNRLSFSSANQLVKDYGISRATASAIRNQPGYQQGHEMAVSKTKAGGWRLYNRVAGQWMDASLNDMA